MANIQTLKAELDADPLTRGYAGFSDEQVADDINTVYREVNLSSLSGDEVFAATDGGEFGGLTDHKQAIWLAFCGRDSIDPFGTSNVALVQWVFGAGSDTNTALGDLRKRDASRAEELGIGQVRTGDVIQARSL